MGSIPFGSKVGLKLWVGSRSSWSIQRRMCSQELCCNWRKDNWKWFFFVGKWKVLATMGVFRGENLNALSALLLLYFIVSGISGMVWTLTLPFDFLVKSGIWVISDICVNKTNKTKCQDDFVQLGYQSPGSKKKGSSVRNQEVGVSGETGYGSELGSKPLQLPQTGKMACPTPSCGYIWGLSGPCCG